MPNNDHLKSARQMIDDLINDNPDASKQSFHDFLKAKTIARLNPELETDVEDNDEIDNDDDLDVEDNLDDDSSNDDDSSDDDVSVDDDDEGGDDSSDDEK